MNLEKALKFKKDFPPKVKTGLIINGRELSRLCN